MFNKNPKKALLLGISTVLMWSSVAVAFKLALVSISPLQLIALGLTVASLVLGTYLIISKEWHELKTINKKEIINVLTQGISLFLYYALLFTAYDRIPAQIAQPINNTWAFVLVFGNAWLAKEKLAKGEITGMLIAYSGALLIAIGGTQAAAFTKSIDPIGLLCAFSCTFFISSYWLINNRSELSHRISLFFGFAISACIAHFTLYVTNTSWENLTLEPFLAAAYAGLFEWGIPFVTWTLALRLTNSVPTISTLSFFTPFISLVWISIFLKEPILTTTIIGLCFIILGTLTQQKYKNRNE